MEQHQFIRVFSEEERDVLLRNQFVLLSSDDLNGIYTFLNSSEKTDEQAEALDEVGYLLTNEMNF